jgi:hypothetical protein
VEATANKIINPIQWDKVKYRKLDSQFVYLVREYPDAAEIFYVSVRDPLLLNREEYRKLKSNLV